MKTARQKNMEENEFDWTNAQARESIWVSDMDEGYIEATYISSQQGRVLVELCGSRKGQIEINFNTQRSTHLSPPSWTTGVTRAKSKHTARSGQPPQPFKLLKRSPTGLPPGGVEDLDELPVLNEAEVLSSLQLRFMMDRIYTRTGPLLIALNPFKWLPIYGKDTVEQYHRNWGQLDHLPPHCYAVAENAYRNLSMSTQAQVVIICGESGAGKTETTKLMLQYLSIIAGKESIPVLQRAWSDEDIVEVGRRSDASVGRPSLTLGDKMVQSNPLMEAFGNAKTIRNNNSSRFGKFTSYCFSSEHGKLPGIVGGEVVNFLLEKSRVVHRPSLERSFHIFYQLCTGASEQEREIFQLPIEGCSAFQYIREGCSTIEGMDDMEAYESTKEAMEAVGMYYNDQMQVMRIVAAILHLGNIKFQPTDEIDANTQVISSLKTVADLLGINASKLGQGLVTFVRALPGGKSVTSYLNEQQAKDARDALAKEIYSRLFNWLVARINSAFGKKNKSIVGILDIFGFENLERNGFEQLFINFTNEQLQHLFNRAIFRAEAEEYDKENISWDQMDFPDNQLCLELLEKRPLGLLPFLDAECSRGAAASDGVLVRKWHKSHGAHPCYEACGLSTGWKHPDGTRTDEHEFVVRHFAGPVIYTCKEFVTKNRDALFDHLYDVMTESSEEMIMSLFPPRQEEDSFRSGRATVAHKFQGQIRDLLGTLNDANLSFVRCIKTNSKLAPSCFERVAVLNQLRCGGVFAALEVRKAGFPSRISYWEFSRHFRALRNSSTVDGSDDRAISMSYMEHPLLKQKIKSSQYRYGESKIFFQADVLQELQDIRDKLLLPFARRIQCWWINVQQSFLEHKFKAAQKRLASARARSKEERVFLYRPVKFAIDQARNAAKAMEPLSTSEPETFRPALNAFAKETLNASSVLDECIIVRDKEAQNRAEVLEMLDHALSRAKKIQENLKMFEAQRDTSQLETEIRVAVEECDGLRKKLLHYADQENHMIGRLSDLGHRASLMIKRSFTNIGLEGNTEAALDKMDRKEVPLTDPPSAEILSERLEKAKAAVHLMDIASSHFQDLWNTKAETDKTRAVCNEDLKKLFPLLEEAEQEAKDEGVLTLPHIDSALNVAWEAFNIAETTLQGIDVSNFTTTVGLARDAFEEACELCQNEIKTKKENSKRTKLRSRLKNAEVVLNQCKDQAALAGLDSEPSGFSDFWAALKKAEESLSLSISNTQGNVEALESMVDTADKSISELGSVWAKVKILKEKKDRDRAVKRTQIQPAVDCIEALSTKIQFTPLMDEDSFQSHFIEAKAALSQALRGIEGANVSDASHAIQNALQLCEKAERVFSEQAHKRAMMNMEITKAQNEVESIAKRATSLAMNCEAICARLPPTIVSALQELEEAIANSRSKIQEASDASSVKHTMNHLQTKLSTVEQSVSQAKSAKEEVFQQRESHNQRLAELSSKLGQIKFHAEEHNVSDSSKVVNLLMQSESLQTLLKTILSEEPDLFNGTKASLMEAEKIAAFETIVTTADHEVQTEIRKKRLEQREHRGVELALQRAETHFNQVSAFITATDLMDKLDDQLSSCKRKLFKLRTQFDNKDHAPSTYTEQINKMISELGELDIRARELQSKSLEQARHKDIFQAKLNAISERISSSCTLVEAAGSVAEAVVAEILKSARAKHSAAIDLLHSSAESTIVKNAVESALVEVQQLEDHCQFSLDIVRRGSQYRQKFEAKLTMISESAQKLRTQAIFEGLGSNYNVEAQLRSVLDIHKQVLDKINKSSEEQLVSSKVSMDEMLEALLKKFKDIEGGIQRQIQESHFQKKERMAALAKVGHWAQRHSVCLEQSRAFYLQAHPDIQASLSLVERELENLQQQITGVGDYSCLGALEKAVLQEEALLEKGKKQRKQTLAELQKVQSELPDLLLRMASAEASCQQDSLVGELCEDELNAAQGAMRQLKHKLDFWEDTEGSIQANVEAATEKLVLLEISVSRRAQTARKAKYEKEELLQKMSNLESQFHALSRELALCRARALREGLYSGARDWQDLAWWDSHRNGEEGRPSSKETEEVRFAAIFQLMAQSEREINTARSKLYTPLKEWITNGSEFAHSAMRKASESVEATALAFHEVRAVVDKEARERMRMAVVVESSRRRLAHASFRARQQGIKDNPDISGALEAAESSIKVLDSLVSSQGALTALRPCCQVVEAKLAHAETLIGGVVQQQGREDVERAVAQEKVQQASKLLKNIKDLVKASKVQQSESIDQVLLGAHHAIDSMVAMAVCRSVSSGQLLFEANRALLKVEEASAAISSELTTFEEGATAPSSDSKPHTQSQDSKVQGSLLEEEDIRLIEGIKANTTIINSQLTSLETQDTYPANSPQALGVNRPSPVMAWHSQSVHTSVTAIPAMPVLSQQPNWMEDYCKSTGEYMGRTTTAFEAMAANMHFLTKGLLEVSKRVEEQAAVISTLTDTGLRLHTPSTEYKVKESAPWISDGVQENSKAGSEKGSQHTVGNKSAKN